MKHGQLFRLFGRLAFAVTIATTAPAQLYTNLYQFGGDGEHVAPLTSLTVVGSKLYGTELGYDTSNDYVFAVNFDGSGYTNFPAGCYPNGLMVVGSSCYGTTWCGGSNNEGTIFAMNLDGSGYTDLFEFASSRYYNTYPNAWVTASGATLYGTTHYGGINGLNLGTIFAVNTNGTDYTILYMFGSRSNDGSNPRTALTAIGSTLYGTTPAGGRYDEGILFAINTDGSGYTNLHSFGSAGYQFNELSDEGVSPLAPLTASGATLYGTTQSGGTNDAGTIFSINTNGTGYTIRYEFGSIPVPDGAAPSAALTVVGATLYGTTQSGGTNDAGTIFSINTNGTDYTVLYNFGSIPQDGFFPQSALILVGTTLYGTTQFGGTNGGGYGDGTLFAIQLATVSNVAISVDGNPADDGTVSGGGMYPIGSPVSIAATANNGFIFTGWQDGNTQNPRTITVPAGGAIYVANFVPQTRLINLSGNLALGNVYTGSLASATLTINNTGNSSLTVSNLVYPAGFSGAWSGTIPAGSAHDITVTFAPTVVTNYGGTVTVTSDATGGTGTMAASGTGIVIPTKVIGLTGNLAFGPVTTGSLASATLTINNTGNSSLTVSNLDYPAGFSGAWSGPIPAGSAHDITVTFAPTVVTNYGGTVTVTSDATGGTGTMAASGTGIVIPTKVIGLTGNLAFGPVTTGSLASATLTINNTGNSSLTVSNLGYPAGFSGAWSGPIPAGSAHDVTVTFAPTVVTNYGGTVTVASDATGGTGTMAASGTGIVIPTKVIGLTGNLAFGPVTTGSLASATLTINNTGNSSLTVSNLDYPAGFSGAWSGTIPAGSAHDVTVTFAPTVVTNYGGTVTVTSDATGGTGTMAASGTGIVIPTKVIGLTGNLAFGPVTTGSLASATLTINNTGNSSLTVSNLDYPAGFSGAWSGPIPAGSAHDVTVTFAPTVVTNYGGTVTVASDATGGTGTMAASGTGIVIPTKVIGLTGNLAFGPVTTGSLASATLTINNTGNSSLTVSNLDYPAGFSGAWSGTIPAGSAHDVTVTFAPTVVTNYGGTVTVTSDATGGTGTMAAFGTGVVIPTKVIGLTGNLAFGPVTTGSLASATLTINNTGNSSLTISNLDYPAGFSGAWSGPIPAGSAHDVTVTFAPTVVTNYGGTVTVTSDATGGTGTMAASGTGVVIPTKVIGLTGNLAFGPVTTGSLASATLTINNTGNSSLTVSNLDYPAGFSGAWSGPIPAGSAHDVTVTFAPTVVTNYGGTVTVASDATGGTGTMAASGTGVRSMTVRKLHVRLNFAKHGADSLGLTTKLDVPGTTNVVQLTGATVVVDVGDVQVPFLLNKRGRGVGANRTCVMVYTKPTKTKPGCWTLTAALSKGTGYPQWGAYGLTNATIKAVPAVYVTLPVGVLIGDEAFAAEKQLHYTATQNKRGTAK